MPQDGQSPEKRSAGAPTTRKPVVPSAVLAVLIFVLMEAMFFTGLISAFLILKAGIKPGMWPPPWQPRLPVEITGGNTAVLVASGVMMFLAARAFVKQSAAAKKLLVATMALGGLFVVVQGVEWVRLLSQGLRLTTSNHGAFFYLIVGTHALHALGGIAALAWAFNRMRRQTLTPAQLRATQIFWTFVVGLWPILYTLVYL